MRPDIKFVRYIDATLLKPDTTREQMLEHLEKAKKHNFKTVAIGCAWIPMAAEILSGTDVGIDAPSTPTASAPAPWSRPSTTSTVKTSPAKPTPR